jgi:hypothetical protein
VVKAGTTVGLIPSADIPEKDRTMKIEEQFDYFEKQTGIEIPINIRECYLGDRNTNSEFIRLFKYEVDTAEKGYHPDLGVLISSKFAKEILKLIYEYSCEDRTTTLLQHVFDYNNYGSQIKIEPNTEDFVVEEIFCAVSDYNYIENKFKFPLIQKAFENIGSNTEEIKVILILWSHCGGEGGIIVRGKNTGFDSGYTHIDFSEVEFEGKKYGYQGFSLEEHEKPHRPILENLS